MKTSVGRSGSDLQALMVVADEMGRRGIGGKFIMTEEDRIIKLGGREKIHIMLSFLAPNKELTLRL